MFGHVIPGERLAELFADVTSSQEQPANLCFCSPGQANGSAVERRDGFGRLPSRLAQNAGASEALSFHVGSISSFGSVLIAL